MPAPHSTASCGLTSMQRARLATALGIAGRGWRVFPLIPGTKRPVFAEWERHASSDPTRISGYWARRPDCNIAIACGPSGLLVVDLDQPKPHQPLPESLSIGGSRTGAQALGALAHDAAGEVPATHTVRSPSGGTHLYYRAPTSARLGNTQGFLAELIDTRGHGGYVVAPGSLTPEGAYELLDDRDPADLPGWLAQALAPKPSAGLSAARDVPSGRLGAYVAAVCEKETALVRAAPRGQHNCTLFIAACRLGELVGADALDHASATHMLQQSAAPFVASDCDCADREVTRTIASGLRTGARNPRRLPARPGRAA